MLFSSPLAIARKMAQQRITPWVSADSKRFDALELAGFKVERFGDMYYHLNERLGGHYVDVGASAKIAQGLVSSKALVCRYPAAYGLFSRSKSNPTLP